MPNHRHGRISPYLMGDKYTMHRSMPPFTRSVSSKYGAPMGRPSDPPNQFDLSEPLHVQQVRFVDGDYDQGGAYWGSGKPLYCVWDGEGHSYYHRAASAKELAAELKKIFPGAVFDVRGRVGNRRSER